MKYLLDTNVLLRLILVSEADHAALKSPVAQLLRYGGSIAVTDQGLREVWHVLTRSPLVNGYGRLAAQAAEDLAHLET